MQWCDPYIRSSHRSDALPHTDDRPAAGAAVAVTAGAADVEDALDRLRSAVDVLAEVDPTDLDDQLVTRTLRDLSTLDGRLDGIKARFVRAAESAGVPQRSGATSTTDWLSQATGRSKREAARTGRMARTMDAAPELAERLAAGDVGVDQADRIARGLDQGTLEPTDAADLLDHATHLPPAQFNRETKRMEGRRQQRRLREQEHAAHQARSGSMWRQDDDSLGLKFQLSPADGDLVRQTFDAFVSPDPAEIPDHLRRTPRQLLADALTDICRTALAASDFDHVAGEPPRITALVGPEMFAAGKDAIAAGATAVTSLDTVLSVQATKQLLCDATIQRAVISPDGQVLDVGRATRKWPPSIRTAIAAMDGGDRTPGSDLPPQRCIVHHVQWWSNGGETSVDNGALLGPRGHDMIHKEGWDMQMDPTTRICTWTSPDGTHTIRTHPRGTAARGPGALHDIPQLQAARPSDTTDSASSSADQRVRRQTTRSTRPDNRPDNRHDTPRPSSPTRTPTSRGDPPPNGADPPHGANPPDAVPLPLDL